jgi:Putative peptidoglycan binding domain/NlpC/P60 family
MAELKVYTNIDDIPLDVWDGNDLGDSGELKPATPFEVFSTAPPLIPTAGASAPSNYVPFKRVIKNGMVGKDCFAVKRGLSFAGFGKWGAWNTKQLFGPFAVKNLKGFQDKHNLPVTGIYDLATHKKLSVFFDDYSKWLMGQVVIISPRQKKINLIESTAMLGYTKRQYIHYTQGWLRMEGVRKKLHPPQYPNWEDCSSFSTWCYYVAGITDPNGLGYNGLGYTGTLAQNGTRVTSIQTGDLIFYGGGPPYTHVAIAVSSTRVVSHGSESGPVLLDANYRPISAVRRYI